MKIGKLSPELLQKLKDSVNILEVIGEHVVLRKTGANFVGLCPFHSERTPSFSVSENKQLYHCYGCKKGGDLISFVMEILGVSFPEAIEELSDRAKFALPADWNGAELNSELSAEEDARRKALREKQNLSFKLNRFAAAYFHQTLASLPHSGEYFHRRSVNSDLIQGFYLGAATDSWDDLSRHFKTKKAPIDLAVELGLIRPSVKTSTVQSSRNSPGYFDLFRGRVMFPILNLRGKIAGFGGRTLGDDTPKYLNSPESSIFQKSKLAFGLFQAQKHIREKDEVILVEGYFDVLAMHTMGFQNVVATCGTALTVDHLNLFKRFASRVTVLFDGDKAGITATERAMEIGLDYGWVLYGAQIPVGKDPDEVVLEAGGKERMANILQDARPILDTRIDSLILSHQKDPGNSEKLTQSVKQMGVWLARLQDSIGREVRIQEIQKKLGVSRHLLEEAMDRQNTRANRPAIVNSVAAAAGAKKSKMGSGQIVREGSRPKEIKKTKLTQTDRVLLSGLVYGDPYTKAFLEARGSLPPEASLEKLLEYGPAQDLIGKLLVKPGLIEKLKTVPDSIWDEVGTEGGLDASVRSIITEALLNQNPPTNLEDFKAAIFRCLYKLWARFSQRIKVSISEAEIKKDTHLQSQWMKEYLDVQRKMKEFSSFYDEE